MPGALQMIRQAVMGCGRKDSARDASRAPNRVSLDAALKHNSKPDTLNLTTNQ
jgi:hypothetical protein